MRNRGSINLRRRGVGRRFVAFDKGHAEDDLVMRQLPVLRTGSRCNVYRYAGLRAVTSRVGVQCAGVRVFWARGDAISASDGSSFGAVICDRCTLGFILLRRPCVMATVIVVTGYRLYCVIFNIR